MVNCQIAAPGGDFSNSFSRGESTGRVIKPKKNYEARGNSKTHGNS